MISPFDIIKIINEKSTYDKEDVISSYSAWVVNKALSNMLDTLLFAQEMNHYHHLPKDIQFDFYLKGIPKGKRFGKWHKIDTSEETLINILCKTYSCNQVIAKKYLSLLNEEQRQQLMSGEGGNDGTVDRGGGRPKKA